MLIYQLTRPFAYILIKHSSKFKVDVCLPFLFSIILSATCLVFKKSINVWGLNGLVSDIQSTIQILPGFYIAALAAIIALGKNERLDEYIAGDPPPSIRMYKNDFIEPTQQNLTRRHFLSLLFSYLTIISLLLCICFSIVLHLIPILHTYNIPTWVIYFGYYTGTLIFFFFLFQIIFITLLGLFYISDKMFS